MINGMLSGRFIGAENDGAAGFGGLSGSALTWLGLLTFILDGSVLDDA